MERGCHVPGNERIQEQLRHGAGRSRHEMRLGQKPMGGQNHLSEDKFLDPWGGLSDITVLRSVLHGVSEQGKVVLTSPSDI